MLQLLLKQYKTIRRHLFSSAVKRNCQAYKGTVKANYKTKVTKQTIIGKNFNSNGLTISGKGKVIIGDNFHCGGGCIILSENHNINGDALPYDDTYIIKDVVIDDNVWLGVNVIILPGVHICEGVVIQAGSVVTKSIPALSIAGGHPARIFAQRDEGHYFKLKAEGRFH